MEHCDGIGVANAMRLEEFARQIEPAAVGVLGDVAQDIGELQGAAEQIRDAVGRGAGIAEDADREMPDGARDPGAVEIERGERRGANASAASISMPSIIARKSSRRSWYRATGSTSARPMTWRGVPAKIASISPRQCVRPARFCRGAPARRRYRRPRGRRHRSRTWRPGAAPAGCASPNRTSCRRPARGCGPLLDALGRRPGAAWVNSVNAAASKSCRATARMLTQIRHAPSV